MIPYDTEPGLFVERDGERVCLYKPTLLQQVFHAATEPNVLMEGSRGGGKSTAMRFDAYMRCLSQPDFKALIIRRVMPELRRSHLKFVPGECLRMGGDKIAKYNSSLATVTFPETGSTIEFGHADDEKSVERYLSSEYDAQYWDEVVTFSLREFMLITASVRTQAQHGRMGIVRAGTNPIGRGARWVRAYWLDKNPPYEEAPDYDPSEWAAIHMDMDDLVDDQGVPLIDLAAYEKRIGNLPSEALRRAYRHGEWVAEGMAFADWRETLNGKPWHVIDTLPRYKGVPITEIPWIEIVRSLDWGYSETGNPGLCLWFACLPDGTAICFREFYFRQMLPAEVAAEIKRRSDGLKVKYTVADPAMFREHTGESLAETFNTNGVPLIEGDNERESGWLRMAAWLKETVDDGTGARPRMQFYRSPTDTHSCITSTKTIPEMVVDPKNPRDIETRGVQDEAADCVRYFAMSRPAPSREPASDFNAMEIKELIRAAERRNRNSRRLGMESVRRAA
jgi:phage terminase large subunit